MAYGNSVSKLAFCNQVTNLAYCKSVTKWILYREPPDSIPTRGQPIRLSISLISIYPTSECRHSTRIKKPTNTHTTASYYLVVLSSFMFIPHRAPYESPRRRNRFCVKGVDGR